MNAEVQQQKTSSWREVPESALGQASRLVSGAPGQHSGHRGSVDSGMGKPVLGRLWRGRAGPGRRRGQQGNPEHRLYADRMPGPCHRPPLLLTTDKAASAGPVQAPAVVVSGANGNGGGCPHRSSCSPFLRGANGPEWEPKRPLPPPGQTATGAHLHCPRQRPGLLLPRRKQPIWYILITTWSHYFRIALRIESAFPK